MLQKRPGMYRKPYIIGLCSSIQNKTWTDVFQENGTEGKCGSFYNIFKDYFNLA
jgi:hypothetical protein